MGVFGGLRVGSGEILMGLGLRESFEPPLSDPVLVPFSDQDRAKSNPKTELRGAIFAKFARRLSGKHIFAFAEWSKKTQNGHPAGSRAMTIQPQNGA